MHESVDSLIEEAVMLSVEERVRLVERVLDTLHPVDAATLAAWIAEGEDRLEAFERGEAGAIDAKIVLSKHLVP